MDNLRGNIRITGNLVNTYFVCKRKLWLFSREINSYQDNQLLELGRLISEESYRREVKEIIFGNIKIDLIKKDGNHIIIGEIKKSSKFIEASKMQLAFYLYKLKKAGIQAKGELLIPKEKKKVFVELIPEIENKLLSAINDIKEIISKELPPEPVKTKFCKKCSYYEFCFA